MDATGMTAAKENSRQDKAGRLSSRRLAPALALVAGLAAFFGLGLNRYVSIETIREHRELLGQWVNGYGILAGISYACLYAVMIAFSIPGGALMSILGGFLFGTLAASIYVLFGATAGATAVFLAARYALADYLHAKAGPAMRRMENGFNENPLSYLLLLRLIPLFPFWLINIVPALLGVHLRTYVFGTFIGIVPGVIVYTSIGSGAGAVLDAGGELALGSIFEPQFLGPILGLALLVIVPVIYKKFRREGNPPG